MENQNISQNNVAQELIRELIFEKRSERRWKNIRFFIGLFIFILLLLVLFGSASNQKMVGTSNKGGYVSFVRLEGMIAPEKDFSAETVLPLLKDAFSDKLSKGVIIDINSGGGTPVQASLIHDAIVAMKNKFHKKVIVVGEDLLASGAYYVAVGADKIYVNPNTITGSIGVIMKSFGFSDLIKKYGIERRVYTAGVNKDRLDPFLPQNPEDVTKIKTVIDEVHNNFINVVLEGRKGKLKANNKELFSGDFWSGTTAYRLGLVDGLGSLFDVMETEFNVSRYKDYSQSQNVWKQLAGQIGSSLDLGLGSELRVLATSG